jgi:hypothetical protein
MTPLPPHGSLRRRRVLRAIGVAGARLLVPTAWAAALALPRRAAAAEADLTHFEITRDEDGVYLSFTVNFELPKGPEDALARAVPLFFVAEAEVFRDRWYWRDRRIAHPTRVWKIVYQPLTSSYRVTTVGGLGQTYPTREEALLAISRATRWKIAEANQLDDGHYYVEFNYRLDVTLLPRPMQIGVAGQNDWQLLVKRTQRIQ